MSFSILPTELLTEIARLLSATELRTSVDYLLISKRWYSVALPIYLSNLQLSSVHLSSIELGRFPPVRTPLSNLLVEEVEQLTVRLIGHPSKQTALNTWHIPLTPDDNGPDDDEDFEDQLGRDYWMKVGPIKAASSNGGMTGYLWHTEEQLLLPWRHHINDRLITLSDTLSACKNLQMLSFEASSENDGQLGPRWDYLLGSGMTKVVSAIPNNLTALTLDTCGSIIVKSENDRSPTHLCPRIALQLQNFERVRLRMRHICPQVLDTSHLSCNTQHRLKSLIIRLCIPFFPEASYEKHDGFTEFDAQLCPTHDPQGGPLHELMADAGFGFAEFMKLDVMRISFGPNKQPRCTTLRVVDCVLQRDLCSPSEVFLYEDDGRSWDGWEETYETW